MAKGYIIFTEQVNDADAMGVYAGQALSTIFAAGGAPVIAGPPEHVVEGEWHGTQTVMLEFPSVEAARRWYQSDEYQALVPQRHAAAETNAVIFSGFEMPGS